MTSATSNINQLWASLLVDELVRNGVRHFFLSPGSRSTPLVVAIAEHPEARAIVHFDERGSSFAALGFARGAGRPACWVTTSGTALANGFPAIVEAAVDGVPMILLTADRPPELRDTGANQTIDQVKLFGDYVRAFVDLPAPTLDIPPAFLLTTVDRAVHAALERPGPVHLNAMFREPLAPTAAAFDHAGYLAGLGAWGGHRRPYTAYERPVATVLSTTGAEAPLRAARRGLILAGRLSPEAARAAVALSGAWQWPLLPDIGSQLRLGEPGVIAHADLLAGSPAFLGRFAPDAILQLGDRIVSKRINALAAGATPYVVVHPSGARLDPGHGVTHRIQADVGAFCRGLFQAGPPSTERGWLDGWRMADARVGGWLDERFARAPALTEPHLARLVSEHIPAGTGLCLASSMPVRDLDRFASARATRVHVASNRGASGIDGTIATAAGLALGLDRPVTLVIGDLAALHDLNSLPLLHGVGHPVVVVLVNNQGGGIFSFLPISTFPTVFEHYFATPHTWSFEHAALQFGLAYAAPVDAGAFRDAYSVACSRPGPTLIEVRTDRAANVEEHQAFDRSIDHLFSA